MNLKTQIEKLAISSTAHGIHHISNRVHKLSRIFWLLLLVISFVSSIHLITLEIINYLEYPVITNIEVVYKKDPEFPKITFCYKGNSSNLALFVCYFNQINCGIHLNQINNQCYIFNSGLNNTFIRQSEITLESGLQITFVNLNKSEEFDVMITNPRKRYLTEEKIRVGNSIEKDIRINREYEIKLSEPYSNCKQEIQVTNKTLPYFQSDCLFECENEMEKNKSKILEMFKDRLLSNYLRVRRYHKECDQKCPVECESLIYDVSTSNLIKKDSVWNNFVKINIFYESFESELIIEEPKTTSHDLFSQVGGLLGLFLGISIISLAEAIEISSILIRYFIKYLTNLFRS